MNKIKFTFMTSLLYVWLKSTIECEENFIKFKSPNTILGMIPLGAKKNTIPITQVSSVDSEFKLSFKNFLWGIIEGALGILLMIETDAIILGIIFLILGIVAIIDSFQLNLNLNCHEGKVYHVKAFIFQKSKIEEAEESFNKLISNRLDDTNRRKVTEAQTNALVDAIKSTK